MSGFFKFSLFRHLQPSSPNADDIKNIVCEMKQRRVTHIIVGQLLEFYSVYPSSFLLFRILDAFFPHVFRVLLDSNVTHSQSGFCFCNHHPWYDNGNKKLAKSHIKWENARHPEKLFSPFISLNTTLENMQILIHTEAVNTHTHTKGIKKTIIWK